MSHSLISKNGAVENNSIDICPVCQSPNGCSMACKGESAYDCWCFEEHFPAEVLYEVVSRATHPACICRDCLNEMKKRLADG